MRFEHKAVGSPENHREKPGVGARVVEAIRGVGNRRRIGKLETGMHARAEHQAVVDAPDEATGERWVQVANYRDQYLTRIHRTPDGVVTAVRIGDMTSDEAEVALTQREISRILSVVEATQQPIDAKHTLAPPQW